jgi:two-component system invasion response regulator UvrY
MSSVLIADDHAVFRAGLRLFLKDVPGVTQIGEASSGNDTLAMLKTARWDLLLLDLNMPDRGGMDILRHVRSGHSDTRILVMSAYPEKQYAVNVLRAGASGYLAKDSSPEEMLKAVRVVLQGRRYVSEKLAEMLVDVVDQGDQPLHTLLSEREFQILGKLASGQTVSEIARELCLSVKTISTYRARVLEKLGLRTNADLTAYAFRNEIIQ